MNAVVVEKERDIRSLLHAQLKREGFSRIVDLESLEGIERILKKDSVNLLIVDLEICQKELWKLEAFSSALHYLIYLSTCRDDFTINKAIETEPVGYLLKPIDQTEFTALLRLVKRKFLRENSDKRLFFDDEFSFSLSSQELYKNNVFVKLSKKEKELLSLLVGARNKIVRFDEIEALWELPPKPSTFRTMIYRLRNKLEHRFIKTVPNQGLVLEI